MSNQLLGKLRDANPIPHPDRLLTNEADARTFLATVQERRHGMADKTQPQAQPIEAPPRPPDSRPDSKTVISVVREPRRRFVFGLAAAVAVLMVGTLTWIAFLNDGEKDVAPAPVDIGRSFIEAQDSWDAEAAISLFAPNAVTNHGYVTEVEEYRSNFAWYEALDWHFMVEECNQGAQADPIEVVCTYSYENAWTDAVGVGPYSGSSMRFVIANGRIQELTDTFDSSDFQQVWTQFKTWVISRHRTDVNVLYSRVDSSAGVDTPRVTPEALVLWEQYTNEFVAAVTP